MFSPATLEDALNALGAVLTDRGLSYELVVVGGGSLMLSGWIERPTKDLDVVALVEKEVYRTARPIPELLKSAARDVAALLGLDPDWLNEGPTDQLRFGLPPGFPGRVEMRRYGGLTIALAGRYDQICLKLYAAVDDHRRGKHFADLVMLGPSRAELESAASWVKTQEAEDPFWGLVDETVDALQKDLGHEA